MKRQVPAFVFYSLFAFFPVLYLGLSGVSEWGDLFNARRAGLLENSVSVAFPVAFFSVIIAVFAALRLYQAFRKKPALRWFFLLPMTIPSYIYALTYMDLIRYLGRFFPFLLRYRNGGILTCILVEIFTYLPLACGAALWSLEQMDVREWKAGLLFDKADRVYWQVVFPKQFPYVLAAGALIFVLSVTDYSIPSLFQVNVYAMEIFSDYSAFGSPASSLYLSLPLILLAALFILPCFLPLRRTDRPMPVNERVYPDYSKALTMVSKLAAGVLLIQFFVPLITLLPALFTEKEAFVSSVRELMTSFASGILAALIMTPLAMMMALLLSKDNIKGIRRYLCFLAAVFPVAVPGVLSGIGTLKFFSDSFLYPLRSTLLLPAIGLAVRYLPFSFLLQYGAYIRMDRRKTEAADLLKNRWGASFFRVWLPLMSPGILLSFFSVFLLTLGDVGTALVLMPAGKEPLSVKIYNYLHYGASETVAMFCLVQMIACVMFMAILYLLLSGKGREKKHAGNS